jgi:hypothetical protein
MVQPRAPVKATAAATNKITKRETDGRNGPQKMDVMWPGLTERRQSSFSPDGRFEESTLKNLPLCVCAAWHDAKVWWCREIVKNLLEERRNVRQLQGSRKTTKTSRKLVPSG